MRRRWHAPGYVTGPSPGYSTGEWRRLARGRTEIGAQSRRRRLRSSAAVQGASPAMSPYVRRRRTLVWSPRDAGLRATAETASGADVARGSFIAFWSSRCSRAASPSPAGPRRLQRQGRREGGRSESSSARDHLARAANIAPPAADTTPTADTKTAARIDQESERGAASPTKPSEQPARVKHPEKDAGAAHASRARGPRPRSSPRTSHPNATARNAAARNAAAGDDPAAAAGDEAG